MCIRDRDSTTGENHDTSAHFVWIGDRTRQLDGGHVEFCRGIENPIGIKCGPTLKADDLIDLCNRINPKNEKGKITLISRFGADNVSKFLPKLIRAIKKEGLNVIWSCDPCHGNTVKAATGFILLQRSIKSSGFKVGPHLIPIGFSIPLQNST